MRSFIAMFVIVAAAATAAADDYIETRDLDLNVEGLDLLVINAGAGGLDVRGVAGQDSIVVRATIVIPDADEDDGRDVIERELKLDLQASGRKATLVSDFRKSFWGFGSNGRVDIEVSMPPTLELRIKDGSGSIDVANVTADVAIDDGSGSIDVNSVGNLIIDDGSGSIDVADASGDVEISDGSGSISVERVGGSVTIDDGSGGIRVHAVEQDLIIIDAGSGSVNYTEIRGRVETG